MQELSFLSCNKPAFLNTYGEGPSAEVFWKPNSDYTILSSHIHIFIKAGLAFNMSVLFTWLFPVFVLVSIIFPD